MSDQKSSKEPLCQWVEDRAKEAHQLAADVYKDKTGDNRGACPVKELGWEAIKGAAGQAGADLFQYVVQPPG